MNVSLEKAICKLSQLAVSVFVFTATLLAQQISASTQGMVTITFKGSIVDGTDFAGIFGDPGKNLQGSDVSLTATFNPTVGTPYEFCAAGSHYQCGSSLNGHNVTSSGIAVLTIANRSYTFGSSPGKAGYETSIAMGVQAQAAPSASYMVNGAMTISQDIDNLVTVQMGGASDKRIGHHWQSDMPQLPLDSLMNRYGHFAITPVHGAASTGGKFLVTRIESGANVPVKGCTITTQTFSHLLPNRSRNRIGVGEIVKASVTPGHLKWSVFGAGRIVDDQDSQVTLVASDRAGTVRLSASSQDYSCSFELTVVEPTGLLMVRDGLVEHTRNRPDIGFRARIYITPADVSFENIEVREVDVPRAVRESIQ